MCFARMRTYLVHASALSECRALIVVIKAVSDSEDMPVRVTNVHLAQVPGHVSWWPRYFESLRETVLVNGVDIIHQDAQPHALVARLVVKRRPGGTFAASALAVLAQEDLAIAGADSTEIRRIAPVPGFFPSELLEPFKTFFDVGDIQDRSQSFCEHGRNNMPRREAGQDGQKSEVGSQEDRGRSRLDVQ